MSKTVADAEVDAAIKGLTAGPGAQIVDQFAARHRAAPAHDIRMAGEVASMLLGELELARLTAARLGVEVLAHRRNIKIHESAPPSKMRECSNCLHYAATLSADATAEPAMQSISKDPGVCTLNPPTSQQRGAPPNTSIVSIFPTVHPLWRCGHWARVATVDLKVPSE